MNHCSNCGQDFEGDSCPKCGKAVEETLKCAKCGAEISGNFCPNCGAVADDANKCKNCGRVFKGNFCPNCGTPANGSRKCPNCGKEVEGNFCANCGYDMRGAQKPAAPVQQKTPSKVKAYNPVLEKTKELLSNHWKWLIIAVLLLVTFLTLMITLVGLRGIYVNVHNPDDYYDFDAISYRASNSSPIFGDIDELEEGKWKISGGKLVLTVNDDLFGKISADFDFSHKNGYKKIYIDKVEYKRVSLIGLQHVTKNLKIKFDAQGGKGGTTKKLKIGTRLPSLEDWKIEDPTGDYTFLGWYTEPNGQGDRYQEDERMWEDRTYYAYWCKDHVASDYEVDGDYHWQVCERCGEEFNNGRHNITWVVTQQPTCVLDGTEAYQCVCGYKEVDSYEERAKVATGHTYGDWIYDEENKCNVNNEPIARHRVCNVCDFVENDDSYVVAHTWKDQLTENKQKECAKCGYKVSVYEELDDKIYFGEYPQTKETNNGITATLAQMSGDRPAKGNAGKWTDYGKADKFMWYLDIEYSNAKYRGVFLINSETNGDSVTTLYWFKWEPIEWRVLEKVNGEAFLMSNIILDSQQYYHAENGTRVIDRKTVYPNNYQYSDIRTWLNDKFYNWAFGKPEQSIIKTTFVDNSASTTVDNSNMCVCENTNDKVFLLSYKDAINTKYGFSSSSESDSSRSLCSTDYAQSQGGYYTCWWLRSPYSYYSSNLCTNCVDDGGDIYESTNGYVYTYYGVVPAIKMAL